MAKQELEIIITPDGEVNISVNGAAGAECVELTKGVEEALGHVVERKFKPEYYQPSHTTNVVQQQNRQP